MMAHKALNDPFNPDTPFFDVWPDSPPKIDPEAKKQVDLYASAHFRDGNLKSSKRHTRKNKKMAKRRNRA